MRSFRTFVCILLAFSSFSRAAVTIYDSPVSGESGVGNTYANGSWYHQIYQNTGQAYQLDQFRLHVNVGEASSTHNLTGTYGLEVYDFNAGSRGDLLGSFTASSISNQFSHQFSWGSRAYRTFTFDFAPGAVTIPTRDGIFLLFKTTDTATTYTSASGINSPTGWLVRGQSLDGSTFWNAGSTLGTVSVSAVPEPSALSLLVVGVGGVIALRRCRRSAV